VAYRPVRVALVFWIDGCLSRTQCADNKTKRSNASFASVAWSAYATIYADNLGAIMALTFNACAYPRHLEHVLCGISPQSTACLLAHLH